MIVLLSSTPYGITRHLGHVVELFGLGPVNGYNAWGEISPVLTHYQQACLLELPKAEFTNMVGMCHRREVGGALPQVSMVADDDGEWDAAVLVHFELDALRSDAPKSLVYSGDSPLVRERYKTEGT